MFLPLSLLALFAPLVAMFHASFGDEPQSTFQWYRELFNDQSLIEALIRSFLVAAISAAVATLLAVCNGLCVHRWFRSRLRYLSFLSLVSLMMPELILGLSLLSWFSFLQPIWHLQLGLATVVIAHATLTMPFASMVIVARLGEVDRQLDDAARDLGANEIDLLFRVTLPMLMPAVLAAYLLCFVLSFDDFLVSYFTNGSGQDTLPVLLYSLMKTGLTPKIQAMSSLVLLFTALVAGLMLFVLLRFRRQGIGRI